MGAFDRGGSKGVYGGIHVDWIEKTTKQEDILGKKRFFLPLSSNFSNFYTC
jgi:hypothetical protein